MKNLREYILNENNFFKNLGIGQGALIKKWLSENVTNDLRDQYNNLYSINDDLKIDIEGKAYLFHVFRPLCNYDEITIPDFIKIGKIKVHGHFTYDKLKCSDWSNILIPNTQVWRKLEINNCNITDKDVQLVEDGEYNTLSLIWNTGLKNVKFKHHKPFHKFEISQCDNLHTIELNLSKVECVDFSHCHYLDTITGKIQNCKETCIANTKLNNSITKDIPIFKKLTEKTKNKIIEVLNNSKEFAQFLSIFDKQLKWVYISINDIGEDVNNKTIRVNIENGKCFSVSHADRYYNMISTAKYLGSS